MPWRVSGTLLRGGLITSAFRLHLEPPEPPVQLPVERQTVPVKSGNVHVLSKEVMSAEVMVPVNVAPAVLNGEITRLSALATEESRVSRESVSTLKRRSDVPAAVKLILPLVTVVNDMSPEVLVSVNPPAPGPVIVSPVPKKVMSPALVTCA